MQQTVNHLADHLTPPLRGGVGGSKALSITMFLRRAYALDGMVRADF